MLIDVFISDWELECCGEPFSVGSDVRWKIHAATPGSAVGNGVAEFIEEHHDQMPRQVPQLKISGRVRAISVIANPLVPDPGSLQLIADHSQSTDVSIPSAPWSDVVLAGHSFDGYRVQLEVADGAILPVHVEDPSAAETQARSQKRAAKRAKWSRDETTVALRELGEVLLDRYDSAVAFFPSESFDRMTIEPHNPDGAKITWLRSKKRMTFSIGNGDWEVGASTESVSLLGRLVHSVAAGRAAEEITSTEMRTVVTEANGQRQISSVSHGFGPDNPTPGLVQKQKYDRWVRGSFRYEPWVNRTG